MSCPGAWLLVDWSQWASVCVHRGLKDVTGYWSEQKAQNVVCGGGGCPSRLPAPSAAGVTSCSLTFTISMPVLFWMIFLLLLIMQRYDHWSNIRCTFNIFRMVEEKELVKSHPYHILKFSFSAYTHHNSEDFQLIWLTYAKMAFLEAVLYFGLHSTNNTYIKQQWS